MDVFIPSAVAKGNKGKRSRHVGLVSERSVASSNDGKDRRSLMLLPVFRYPFSKSANLTAIFQRFFFVVFSIIIFVSQNICLLKFLVIMSFVLL
jgi:hypothetical protein